MALGTAILNNPILRSAAKYALPDLSLQGGNIGKEASFAELCNTLDGYLYNTIFEELGPQAFDIVADMSIEDIRPRGLRNPVRVIVGFYQDHVLTGRMVPPPLTTKEIVLGQGDPEGQPDGDLWIEAKNKQIIGPIMDIWRWSNFQIKLSEISRNAANYGNCLLVVTEDPGSNDASDGKVYIEVRHPAELVAFERHPGRGHFTYAKVESEESELDPVTRQERHYTFTREYTREEIATFKDGKPFDFYGTGLTRWENPHGFVPVVMIRHEMATGDDRGLNAYYDGLPEINEMCLVASTVGTNVVKHNSPQWVATGATAPEKGLQRGDNMWFLPGATSLDQAIAKLDIAGAYQHIDGLWDVLETKYPELLLPKIGDQKRDISGAAVRGILTGLIRRGLGARERYEFGLIDAIQMALSMGGNFGGTTKSLWDVTIPAFGDAARLFTIHWPDILPMNRLERLKLQNDEMAIMLNIINLQLQLAEAQRKAGVATRLVDAVIDPASGLPVDPASGFPTDPTTLLPVFPTAPAQSTPAPGTIGPSGGSGPGNQGQ